MQFDWPLTHVGGRKAAPMDMSEALRVAKYTGEVKAPTTLSSRVWVKCSCRNSPPKLIMCLPLSQVVLLPKVMSLPFHPAAGALRVNVHRHQAVGGAFSKDLYRCVGSRYLREGRYRLPLPPVPQPVQVALSGQVGGQAAGSAERYIAGLGRCRAGGHRAALGIALDHTADINLVGAHAIAHSIVIRGVEVPFVGELVIEFGHAEVVASDQRHRGVKSDGVEPVCPRGGGIVAVRLHRPDVFDYRADAQATRV